MSSREFKFGTKYALTIGSILLFAGIIFFYDSESGSKLEKIGIILMTYSAVFLGMMYTSYVAWRTR